jgi:ATP-dependent DNA helicase RecG
LDEKGLLEKLGAWRKDRQTGIEGLTIAGLLMFGKDEAIRDPAALPQYHLDYRERLSNLPEERWSDRITVDGTWVGNLFQFYQRVILRLIADLKVPFQMGTDLFRKDETLVHEAIREAFVNAIIHADYRGMGGVVIEKYKDRLEMSNPGSLLLSLEQILKGGISECRNKSLQLMFQQIGGGEKAGSGIDKIHQGWASQNWRWPLIEEQKRPDRVKVILPMVSLLPEDSLRRLRKILGERWAELDGRAIQALVTADVEGSVSNQRLQQFCIDHTSDITRLLQDLVAKGFLVKNGYGRWASYQLAGSLTSLIHKEGTPDISSPHNEASSQHNAVSSQHNDPILEDTQLLELASPARQKERITPSLMRQIILKLCQNRYLTYAQIGALLNRHPEGIRNRFLSEMVREGSLLAKYPSEPTHPNQAYQTNPDWKEIG